MIIFLLIAIILILLNYAPPTRYEIDRDEAMRQRIIDSWHE